MRTLFYLTSEHWSGSAHAFAIAARGIAATGEPVTVACRAGSSAEHAFVGEGLDVIALPTSGSVGPDAWRLRTVLKERFIEVVFLHSEREQLVASSAMRLAERGAVIRRIPVGGIVSTGRGARLAEKMATSRLLFSTPMDLARADVGDRGLLAPLGVDVEKADEMRMTSRGTLGVEPGTQLMVCVADRKAKGRIHTALRTVALLAP